MSWLRWKDEISLRRKVALELRTTLYLCNNKAASSDTLSLEVIALKKGYVGSKLPNRFKQ